MATTISINRAPVLMLWAAVVAHRLGFHWDESLSLGKALAGLNAQSKGRRLGIFKLHEEKPKAARERERGDEFWIELCGRPVPAKNTADGIRAVKGRSVITAESAEAYLETKFGDHLADARAAMTTLARTYSPRELATAAGGRPRSVARSRSECGGPAQRSPAITTFVSSTAMSGRAAVAGISLPVARVSQPDTLERLR